jgi:hypothetical protein
VVAVQQGQVRIRRADGKEFTLPVTTFSAADQAFLQQWKPVVGAAAPAGVRRPPLPPTPVRRRKAKVQELPNGDVAHPG